jgi:hypothetical protein
MTTATKNLIKARTEVQKILKKYRVNLEDIKAQNALAAWKSMAGIWKNKKLPDPVKWQRKIRKEWDRKIL